MASILNIFSSRQGEGICVGDPHVFIRFGGCNLVCDYCDTPESIPMKSGLLYTVEAVVDRVTALEPLAERPVVSLTGGEPLVQIGFLEKHHIDDKTDCRVCWARPLCSGGCYHEAHTRYGDTGRANLHYCDWIRGWTNVCLQIYGELSVRNPAFFARFEDEHEASQVS